MMKLLHSCKIPASIEGSFARLLYLNYSRPDVTFAVHQLSQFVQKPTHHHLAGALHVVRYLHHHLHFGLFYSSKNVLTLQAYCDADWAACKVFRRSVTGYTVFLGTSLISWISKKQATVSKSSAEAEYRSLSMTACELKWISYVARDLHTQVETKINLHISEH